MSRWLAIALFLLVPLSGCRPERPSSGCASDEQCDDGAVCRDAECVEPECTIADDCAEGACVARFCEACADDSECGDGMVCAEGDCAMRECTTRAECTGDLGCVGGLCLACASDAHCGAAEACHHGACVERECFPTDGCADGLVCDEGRCLPCGDGAECSGVQGCVDGRCGTCTEDAHCTRDRVCLEGQCRPTCGPTVSCTEPGVLGCRSRAEPLRCGEAFCAADRRTGYPTTTICDPCLETIGGCPSGRCDDHHRCECTTQADCPDQLACRGGVCHGCSEDADCGCDRFCAAGECHARCTADSDCEGGDRCLVETGRCVPCLGDGDCGGGTCYQDGCSGMCGAVLSCAPFVPCEANGRCGFCGQCGVGPRRDPIGACP